VSSVTIFGSGNMGRAIGTRALAGGNDVQILDREPKKAADLAGELTGGKGTVTSGTIGDPISGDIVVLAVWYPVSVSLVQQHAAALGGKVIVDIANPVDPETYDRLVTPPDSSAAEEVAKVAPAGAKVVKAFNTTFAGTLVEGQVAGQPLDVFIAGDDADAKAAVAELVESGGLRPIDAGPLNRARYLDGLGFLHIGVQMSRGTQFNTAVKLLD
jgi:8-hydroxy-5-deazaflavin:NADPH oxidoreductase